MSWRRYTDPESREYYYSDDGVAQRVLPNGVLAIHPDSILWATRDTVDLTLDIVFDRLQISQQIDYISNKRREVSIDQFELHVTERCNLRCKYCYVPEDKLSHSRFMPRGEIDIALGKIYEFGLRQGKMPRIHFHGGEPGLFIKQIKDIVNSYNDKFRFAIQTNGTSIKNDDLKFLIDNDVDIGVSLDLVGDGNDDVRSRGSYRKTMETISFIGKYANFFPNVISTISVYNVDKITSFCKDMLVIGVNSVSLNPVTAYLPGTEITRPNEDLLIKNYIEAVEWALDETRHTSSGFFINNMESLAVSILTGSSASYCEITPCGAARYMAVVQADGSLTPCSGMMSNNASSCGNIINDTTPIEVMLSAPPAMEFRSRDIRDVPGCADCLYRQICGGNCAIPHYNRGIGVNHKSTWCRFRFSLIDFIFNETAKRHENILDFISYETRASLMSADVHSVVTQ